MSESSYEHTISRLRKSIGWFPDELLALYHNAKESEEGSFVRLMPVDEVLETNANLASAGFPRIGPVSWFWTDYSSNYCGIYTNGPLKGWLTRLNHEEPMLTPAYRSVAGFLSCVARSGEATDLPCLVSEIPTVLPGDANAESDRKAATYFGALHREEKDADLKRLYAFCSICLTPVEDTGNVLPFLGNRDFWISEAAVRLLELRGYDGGISELEALAREGQSNGASAAVRQLVRLNTEPATQAIVRLKQVLEGQKLRGLEMWERTRLQPPRWP
jgi:hypothetical protein